MNLHRDTCVIIPVYNEAEVLGTVLKEIRNKFSNVLCVDDGSTDNSPEIIKKAGVRYIFQAKNKGQGAALRTGLQVALQDRKVKYFVTFDADGQHAVSDALAMLQHLKKTNADIVLGSRFLHRTNNIPFTKRVVLRLAIVFSNLTTGLKLTDTHNGLRVFKRRVALKLHLTSNGMAHASEIMYRIAENSFRYDELPVTIQYSDYSKAKGQSVLNSFHILKEIIAYRLQRENEA